MKLPQFIDRSRLPVLITAGAGCAAACAWLWFKKGGAGLIAAFVGDVLIIAYLLYLHRRR